MLNCYTNRIRCRRRVMQFSRRLQLPGRLLAALAVTVLLMAKWPH